MAKWFDYNDADPQQSFDVIPKGTMFPVRMTIKPGGYDDPSMGWTGGYATRAANTGAIYLNAEFTVLEGPYAKRKIWSLIGLHSEKGPAWANMGRSFVRAVLNSAYGIKDKDDSQDAMNARRIESFAELDGIEFIAKVDVGKDARGDDRNEVRTAITADSDQWADWPSRQQSLQEKTQRRQQPGQVQSSAPASNGNSWGGGNATTTPPAENGNAAGNRPAWAS